MRWLQKARLLASSVCGSPDQDYAEPKCGRSDKGTYINSLPILFRGFPKSSLPSRKFSPINCVFIRLVSSFVSSYTSSPIVTIISGVPYRSNPPAYQGNILAAETSILQALHRLSRPADHPHIVGSDRQR